MKGAAACLSKVVGIRPDKVCLHQSWSVRPCADEGSKPVFDRLVNRVAKSTDPFGVTRRSANGNIRAGEKRPVAAFQYLDLELCEGQAGKTITDVEDCYDPLANQKPLDAHISPIGHWVTLSLPNRVPVHSSGCGPSNGNVP